MLWQLFWTFFKIGLVSFGGGYAMIPLIREEVVDRHGWLTTPEFMDAIAVTGMSPGPIAANTAIYIGYSESGLAGAIVSAMGMVLPSFLIVIIVGSIFRKVQQNKHVQSAFYGLRAVITGLIVYAAILFAWTNGLFSNVSWSAVMLILIYIGSLIALLRFRIHPVYVILISGLVGIAAFS
jgi:chromate transporter